MSGKTAFTKKTNTFNKREAILTIKPDDVLTAYEKYGDEAFKVDIENSNDYDNVSYINFLIKLANDDTKYIKFYLSVVNIKTCNGLRDPEERDFPNIIVKFRAREEQDKDVGEFTKFGEAANIINMAFSKTIRKMKENYSIACKTDSDAYDNALEQNAECKGLLSVSTSSFFQSSYMDKDTKKRVKMDNPLINVTLGEDVFEKDSSGNKVVRKPWRGGDKKYKKVDKVILVYPFNVKICDYKKTILKNGRLQGVEATAPDSEDEGAMKKITNVNVQKFITPGSMITGELAFQVTVSKQALKLNCSFKKTMYVIKKKRSARDASELSQDLFNQIGDGIGSDYDSDEEKPSANSVVVATTNDDSDEEI